MPWPNRLLVSSKKKLALSSVTAEPDVKRTEPAVKLPCVSDRPRNVPSPKPSVEVACHTGMVPLEKSIVELAPRVKPAMVSAALA